MTPRAALARLAGSSWQHVDQFQSVLRAAQRELPGEDVRARHDRILARLRALIDRGGGDPGRNRRPEAL